MPQDGRLLRPVSCRSGVRESPRERFLSAGESSFPEAARKCDQGQRPREYSVDAELLEIGKGDLDLGHERVGLGRTWRAEEM